MSDDQPPLLTGDQLARLGDLLHRWTGMIFGEKKRYYVERRVAERMRRTGSPDVDGYLAALLHDTAERRSLINAFTINETYFYREAYQFAALSNTILPAIARTKQPGDLLRIWSMPCSTGEEPYSIAIWLLEHWPLVDAYHVEIVGSDIDSDAIAAARAGRYGARALARLPHGVRQAYFTPEPRDRNRIIEDLRESVIFREANLIDAASVEALGRFDVILCRNLLIYFDESARQQASANLHSALHPGGHLCLGHSESMARIDDRFTMVRLDDAIVYRRD
ncbi:chemotaxis protein methyltransferase [Sphingobium sp. SYK-6]|uniref:CheR family methyltransferase n=1 Tax=Sphingobium sp. (strain NBRC 103272 / SYK-6) TaxID=627192 RepID=UPI00022774CE|nr:protein-glutamate O-methyltransferase CheR [Sphingobium sp. SYK-6]BAK66070.1 chemotaxis protein methyltransferase [Sphingobium sp. SYK-6]